MATFTANFPVDARAVATNLDQTGFVALEGVVSPDWLARARSDVRRLLAKHGEKFFVIIKPANELNSAASEIAHHPKMEALLRDLAEIGCPRCVVDGEDVYNVLRVVAGADGEQGSCEFHYDANVITALVPIFIPDSEQGQSGELVVRPNSRGYRNILMNLIEKAVVQSGPYRRRMEHFFGRNPEQSRRLLQPGNVYLFWGYRTYHGNLPSPSNALRATLLLHYGNPHGKQMVLQTFRAVRRVIERRRLIRPPAQEAPALRVKARRTPALQGLDASNVVSIMAAAKARRPAASRTPKRLRQERVKETVGGAGQDLPERADSE